MSQEENRILLRLAIATVATYSATLQRHKPRLQRHNPRQSRYISVKRRADVLVKRLTRVGWKALSVGESFAQLRTEIRARSNEGQQPTSFASSRASKSARPPATSDLSPPW